MNPLLRNAARYAAPRLATLTRGRRKKTLYQAGRWAAGRVTRRTARASLGMLALRGLGAAALALPLGVWVGRKMMHRSER